MKTPRPYIKTLDRLKVANLAERLIRDIDRILPPETPVFHAAILDAGAPRTGQSLRYLPFNRQVHVDGDLITTLSLVVLFNNPCMEGFLLKGLPERLSRWVFACSFNTMDRFIRGVRQDRRLLQIMGSASGAFSIMGIVQRDVVQRRGLRKRRLRSVAPLLLIPGLDAVSRTYVTAFERRQTIGKVKLPLLPLYRKSSGPLAD